MRKASTGSGVLTANCDAPCPPASIVLRRVLYPLRVLRPAPRPLGCHISKAGRVACLISWMHSAPERGRQVFRKSVHLQSPVAQLVRANDPTGGHLPIHSDQSTFIHDEAPGVWDKSSQGERSAITRYLHRPKAVGLFSLNTQQCASLYSHTHTDRQPRLVRRVALMQTCCSVLLRLLFLLYLAVFLGHLRETFRPWSMEHAEPAGCSLVLTCFASPDSAAETQIPKERWWYPYL
ncbi:hypothetical protein QBC37DRAFT_47917 [Rhypophila decipiens]|uniref:Uncharacterized protein n=1 Tax=Rhypophila decipiens TaxID=261697 RepID=A0AAN7B6C9_9PEZI|nr:hypothetical protein QBC37DRAFT_47917 [Rhypophila decipiens]